MKILSIDNMLGAAQDSGMPCLDAHIRAIEYAATALAKELAAHLKVGFKPATWEGEDLAGCCATFYPVKPDQPCPDAIDIRDASGVWEPPGMQTYDSNLN